MDRPPSFHEIRSLSGRRYVKEFVQRLFGHKSEKMTTKYLDSRKKEFMMI